MVTRRIERLSASNCRLPLLLLLLTALVLPPSGCQEPVEPTGLLVPVDITFKVQDSDGKPVPGAVVFFTSQDRPRSSTRQVTTESNGQYVEEDYEIAVTGEIHDVQVVGPFGDPDFNGILITEQIRFPCVDTTLVFVLDRTIDIRCGQTAETDELELSACPDSSDTASLQFRNTTGEPLQISFNSPAVPDLRPELVQEEIVQSAPLSLGANESFRLRVSYSPGSASSSGALPVIVEGRDGNNNICYRIEIRVVFEVEACDSGACRIDSLMSTLFNGAPEDSLNARTDSRSSGRLCIENIGGGPLTVQASQVFNSTMFQVEPEQLVIPAGETDCFTVTFAPTSDSVWPGGRGTMPARTIFTDSLLIGSCGTTIELRGVADTVFPALINNCRTPYSYRNQHCGDIITESDQIVTQCDKDSTEFDWYVEFADPVTRTGRLRSETLPPPFKFVRSNYVPPAATGFGCADPAVAVPATTACNDPNGWTNSVDLSMGDILIFRRGDKCWMLFINSINDANVEGKPLLCYDICRLR